MNKRIIALVKKEITIRKLIGVIVKRNNALVDGAYDSNLIKNESDLEWVKKLEKRAKRIQKQYVRLGYIPCC